VAVDMVDIVPALGVVERYDPSAALEAAAAVFVRAAQPLHHAVHRDVGRSRQFHGRRLLLAGFVHLGRPSWAAAHPYYEQLCPDPTPPPGFLWVHLLVFDCPTIG